MDLIYIISEDPIRGNLIYNFLSGRMKVALLKPHEYFTTAQKENPMVFLFVSSNHDFFKTEIVRVRETQSFYNHGVVCIANNPTVNEQKELFEIGSDMVLNQHTEMERIYMECYSLLRRINGFHNSSVVEFGSYVVDFLKNELQYNGKFFELDPIHAKMLKMFFEKPDQLIARKHMKDTIWKGQEISPRSIDAQISKLKKKFPEIGHNIDSIYGQGYIYKAKKTAKVS